MGEFLSTPIKDKVSEDNEDKNVTLTNKKFSPKIFNIDKIWSLWNARMEKENGRFSHF
jgi:hypothetical protein